MQKHLPKRLLSLVLVLVMVCSLIIPAYAAEDETTDSTTESLTFEKVTSGEETPSTDKIGAEDETSQATEVEGGTSESTTEYADDDIVRVSIVLEDASTIGAGYSTSDIASNSSAKLYRAQLKVKQAAMTASINAVIDGELEVKWNLTLAANIISANVAYGDIETIKSLAGVKDVFLEMRYEPDVADDDLEVDPNMSTSSSQIGSATAWAAGYTGAGSRVAIIDTGIDEDHELFSAAGYNYSLAYHAGLKGLSVEEYTESLDLLDEEEIASVLSQLNIAGKKNATASELYSTSKIPFGYNYIDENNTIQIADDGDSEHGAHVAGIAAANAYIANEDGTFSSALDTVKVQGVAPDAQIIVMRVFSESGGAYDSDYMAAIEDAIVLGCDSVNLSLGSGSPGFSRVSDTYSDILDSLSESDTTVVFSAGNSYNWAYYSNNETGYLYGDDVSFQTNGSPGSYTNSLTVASVNNAGFTGNYITVAGNNVFYTETSYTNANMTTIAGEHEYVFIDGYGTEEEFEALGDVVKGKIVFVSRGSTSFYQKANAAVAAGAIATIIYNNTSGTISMNLTSYTGTAPCVSITQEDGAMIRENSTISEDGTYYTGTLTVESGIGSTLSDDAYTMSSFSSWGTPGSLELKPEITAPGGNIYSVNGNVEGGTGYENMSGTSMAAPQVSGMIAVVAQYVKENGLTEKTGLSVRQLAISLLMSTAVPITESDSGSYYSLLNQGAGLGNVGYATSSDSYIMMTSNLSGTASDGKVKAELGDDPDRTGVYTYSFTINNITDEETSYSLYSDFFTQDMFEYNGETYLDTWTTPIAANVSYVVDGQPYTATTRYECDLDKDGDTDADDAQIILNYVVGSITEIDEIADVNGDGSITSYDAYVLLNSFEVETIEVPANGSVTVTVTATLSDAVKTYFDTYYTSGAYIEGFTYVEPHTTEEGVIAPTHSIPVLAFYGNWSDASMYDTVSYKEYIYAYYNDGTYETPYTGVVTTNNLTYTLDGETTSYYEIGNPYYIESEYPADRVAIQSDTTMSTYRLTLIRNAAAVAIVYQDEDGNVIDVTGVTNQVTGAYYYVNGSSWRNTASQFSMKKKVSTLGLSEGDKFTISVVAIPEYYETDGDITKDQIIELVESGTLGEGAYLSTTMTIDDTAPELLSVTKDLLNGDVTIVASDNQYIAGIMVYKGTSSKLLAGGVPAQDEAGETCGVVVDLDNDTAGEYITVVVADYAGNETAYKVYYGGTPEDYSNRMFGFANGASRGDADRWVEIDPETLTKTTGMDDIADSDLTVTAAEYVNGYVFYTTAEKMYVSTMEDLENYEIVGSLPDDTDIRELAYSTANETLYALDSNNTIYSVDLIYGELTKVAEVTITNPRTKTSSYLQIRGMTIDDKGNFYFVNYGTGSYVYLYTMTLKDVVDGAATIAPINNTTTGYMKTGVYTTGRPSLAYDHATGDIYMACSYGTSTATTLNKLFVIDIKTAKASLPNSGTCQLYDRTVGLFIVPPAEGTVAVDMKVTKIELSATSLELLVGATTSITATAYPWLAEDKTVSWSTSDETIATVDSNGTINAVGVGTATITATSNESPEVTATCEVIVTKLDNIKVSGAVYDTDSKAYWSEFETDTLSEFVKIADSGSYYAGTLHEGELLVHDGSTMYGVDPDTFEVTNYGTIASSWIWSDAAQAPTVDGCFGRMVGLCYNGTYLEMLNPEAGTLSYWNLSSYFSSDPMACIAYIESGTYYYYGYNSSYQIISGDFPANFYYMMTESGKLYKLTLFTYNDGTSYTMVREEIGDTGLSLSGVSSVTGGAYASMLYDATTGYVLVSSYQDGDTCQMYAFDPKVLIPAEIGEFGDSVWPVISLYQYERATDLTLRIDTTAISMYVEDTVAVTAKVILGTTNELTWTTSDASVATVSSSGVITGVGAGTATITVTTVDTNSAGEHVSATITVTVKDLTKISGSVQGQIETETDTVWATIDLSTRTTTTNKSGATAITGGGYAVDALYGSDVDVSGSTSGSIYKIDATTFEATAGSACSTSYAPLDLTDAPATTVTYTTDDETYTATAFGMPIYVSNSQGIFFLKDYVAGSLSGWSSLGADAKVAAVCYIGTTTGSAYTASTYGCDDGTVCNQYLLLDVKGNLYLWTIEPCIKTADSSVTYVRSKATYGNIGMTFSDYTALSMEYIKVSDSVYGLLISDSTDNSLYFADLSGETITCGKVGVVNGAEGITALYNAKGTASSSNSASKIEVRQGTATVSSTSVSMSKTLAETEATRSYNEEANVETTTVSDVTVNAVSGSTNATKVSAEQKAHPDVSVDSAEATVGENTVAVSLSDDVAVTNGKYVVTYDPEVLTFAGVTSTAQLSAYNADETTGTVTIAIASATEIPAETVLATVNFTYTDSTISTEVKVDTLERNEKTVEESVTITVTNTVTIYRVYNQYTNEHLFTSDETELENLLAAGWSLDGVAWQAPTTGTSVYRLYNPYDDWHSYSVDEDEIASMVAAGWTVDGVLCYSATENDVPIYRLFNPYEQKNYHLFTASQEEIDVLVAAGWVLEGVAFYCVG